jgi:hypothetical protein
MLFPKPFHIKKQMELHAHNAHHDDTHNKESIQLEDKPNAIGTVMVAGNEDREKLLQQVEYQGHNQDNDWRNKQKAKESTNHETGEVHKYKIKELLKNEPSSDGGHHGAFMDIFIHQLIETIEFTLGTISNTASYLRLWALSLAHGQLAAVFLENTIMPALDLHSVGGTFFGVWIGYFLWATFTVGVLMSMDVMECFLHTLRLHWVEFQNKFYKGQGYKFTPFDYSEQLQEYTR